MSRLIIIMGVSGCGKTSLGEALSKKFGLPFLDADDFHPKENISKMSKGEALDDSDRAPWLQILNNTLKENHNKQGAILACSALKESYRGVLSYKLPIEWIYIKGDYDLIYNRMQAREHFMPAKLLQSQFDTLEVPSYGLQLEADVSIDEWVAQIVKLPTHFGIVGLGVMGKSLALNALSKGIPLGVYNRAIGKETQVVANFLKEVDTALCEGHTQLQSFVTALQIPRKILLMVPAGDPTEAVIEALIPYLTKGDIIIDGGNAHYKDTQKRSKKVGKHKLQYIGLGVSGGQEGALTGPSLMPGGDRDTIESVRELKAIAAKTNNKACANYMGPDGAGHFVKMIHNGIEYAEMQLLAEVYDVLKAAQFTIAEIAALFEAWQATTAQSYLLGIMPEILRKTIDDKPVISIIKDAASGKGTGVWSTNTALEYVQPATMIAAAVNARFSSSKLALRQALAAKYKKTPQVAKIDLDLLFEAYTIARVVNHYQGLAIINQVSGDQNWNTSLTAVAQNWQAGCILKSTLVAQLAKEFTQTSVLEELLTVSQAFDNDWSALQQLCKYGIDSHLPLPCFNAALNHLYTFTQDKSSANIIQAQRDYFGAHGYKRNDTDNDQLHHTNWKQK